MSLEQLMDRPCTIVHREESDVEYDDYGDPAIVTTETSTFCELQQTSRAEPNAAGEFSTSVWTAWFPSGTLVDTSDKVVAEGWAYEVVGDPWDADRGGIAFVEATLIRTGREDSS